MLRVLDFLCIGIEMHIKDGMCDLYEILKITCFQTCTKVEPFALKRMPLQCRLVISL